ncbi:MAG: M15 family metallopeptidase [Nitrospiraceae bacterium]
MGELEGVQPDLVRLVQRAIVRTPQDFTVHDGLRELEEQREYLRRGVSRTLLSMHLPQDDGYGHAVDLVPYINGRLRWEWLPIYEIFKTVRQIANEMELPVRWGGCWQLVGDTGDTDPHTLVEAYMQRKRDMGKRYFVDGPHYELVI